MAERVSRLELVTRIMGSPWVYWPMCLVGVGLVALAVLGPEARRRIRIEHHRQVMKAEVESIRRTYQQLTASAEALESDPAYTERVVRNDLNLVRPGEVSLPGPDNLTQTPSRVRTLRWQVPPVIALLSPWAAPEWRLGALAGGVCLLAAAVIFSLPNRRKRQMQKA